MLESDFYFPLIPIYIGLYGVTGGRETRCAPCRGTHVRACVRSSTPPPRPPRGCFAVISPLRVGRHMPPPSPLPPPSPSPRCCFSPMGWPERERENERTRGAEVIIFRFMYKCFSRSERIGGGLALPFLPSPERGGGEDAYRKVSRRIEKCSRGFRRARAMMEQRGWISRPVDATAWKAEPPSLPPTPSHLGTHPVKRRRASRRDRGRRERDRIALRRTVLLFVSRHTRGGGGGERGRQGWRSSRFLPMCLDRIISAGLGVVGVGWGGVMIA